MRAKLAPYYIYILRCNDDSLYTGITNDIEHRLLMHSTGKGSKYVRAHLPFKLVYQQQFPDKVTALQAEYKLKRLTKSQKEQLIALSQPISI